MFRPVSLPVGQHPLGPAISGSKSLFGPAFSAATPVDSVHFTGAIPAARIPVTLKAQYLSPTLRGYAQLNGQLKRAEAAYNALDIDQFNQLKNEFLTSYRKALGKTERKQFGIEGDRDILLEMSFQDADALREWDKKDGPINQHLDWDYIKPTLAGGGKIKLDEFGLSGMKFNGTDFTGCSMIKTVLTACEFEDVNLGGVNMTGADCYRASFGGTYFNGTTLDKANLGSSQFYNGCNLADAKFREALMEKVQMIDYGIGNTDFSGAIMNGCLISGETWNNDPPSKFIGTQFVGAEFQGADFSYCDMTGANLQGGKLADNILNDTLFEKANLQDTDMDINEYGENVMFMFTGATCNTGTALPIGFEDPAELDMIFINDKPLAGYKYAITGTLPGMSRAEAKAFIESKGGTVTNTIKMGVHCLLVGEGGGQKLADAKSLGIQTLTLAEFQAKLAK